jgi:hypothetical protein
MPYIDYMGVGHELKWPKTLSSKQFQHWDLSNEPSHVQFESQELEFYGNLHLYFNFSKRICFITILRYFSMTENMPESKISAF